MKKTLFIFFAITYICTYSQGQTYIIKDKNNNPVRSGSNLVRYAHENRFPISKQGMVLYLSNTRTTSIINDTTFVQTWTDNSGYNNNFSQSTASLRPYVSNPGVAFDGVDDQILSTNNFTATDNKPQITITFWVTPINLLDDKYYFEIGTPTGNVRISLLSGLPAVAGSDKNDLIFIVSNGTNTYGYTTSSLITQGQWRFVVLQFDGTQATNDTKMRVCVSGIPQTLTFSGTLPTKTAIMNDKFCLGSQQNQKYSKVKFDEFIIYDRILSMDEIHKLYNYKKALYE